MWGGLKNDMWDISRGPRPSCYPRSVTHERITGGMAFVDRVERRGERVVRKTARPDRAPESHRCIEREARALDVLGERLALRLLAHTMHESQPALVINDLGAENLGQRIESGRAIDMAALGDALLMELALVHDAGFAHRDLKCSNVMCSVRVALIDFGHAEPLGTRVHHEGAFWTQPPEGSGSLVTTAADLYAAGLVLFRATARAHPFGWSPELSADQWREHAALGPPPLRAFVADLEHLDDFFARALSPQPNDRFTDAHDMRRSWLEVTR